MPFNFTAARKGVPTFFWAELFFCSFFRPSSRKILTKVPYFFAILYKITLVLFLIYEILNNKKFKSQRLKDVNQSSFLISHLIIIHCLYLNIFKRH